MDTTLTLTDDQLLRLALLDRCLPVAGTSAVPMAEDAYDFMVRGLADNAKVGAEIDMPARAPAPAPAPVAQIGTDEPGSGIHAGVAETAAKTAMVAAALANGPMAPLEPINVDARARAVVAAIAHLQAARHPVTQAALCEATDIPRGSMTAVLNQAVREGLLTISGPRMSRVYTILRQEPAAGDEASAARLRSLVEGGATVRDLMREFGLGEREVIEALAEQGLAGIDRNGDFCSPNVASSVISMQTAPAKRRKCLRCGTSFLSSGPQHRMCTACRRVSTDMEGV